MKCVVLLLLLSLVVWEIPTPSEGTEITPSAPSASTPQGTLTPGLPDFDQVVQKHSDTLAAIASEAEALKAFTTDLGRALGLSEVAMTLQAKALPAALAKELFVPELQDSANRLMAGLAALRLARSSWAATQSADPVRVAAIESDLVKQREWLERQGLSPLVIGNQAKQLEASAIERVFVEWTRLHHWKDQVRDRRGRTRLCGTWQWTIHNHKTHGEQKLAMTFLSPNTGKGAPNSPTEIVVLGDNVYLRWEVDGRVQEDSLQFTKEGQRLEGTFVNNIGGWGSIAAKRSGPCAP